MEDASTQAGVTRNTGKWSLQKKRQGNKSPKGRKIYSLDGGKTLHMQARGQAAQKSTSSTADNTLSSRFILPAAKLHLHNDKKDSIKIEASNKRPAGNSRQMMARKAPHTPNKSDFQQSDQIWQLPSSERMSSSSERSFSDIFTADDGYSNSTSCPSIVMVSDDTEFSLQNSSVGGGGESVVVESMDDVGVCLEDGVTLDMLDDCTLDVHAEHVIGEEQELLFEQKHVIQDDGVAIPNHLIEAAEMNSEQHIITDHEADTEQLIDSADIQADHVMTQYKELNGTTHKIFYGSNLLPEPECQLIIKKEIVASEDDLEETGNYHDGFQGMSASSSSGSQQSYNTVRVKEEPIIKSDPLLEDADPDQLIQLYVNNSQHLVRGLSDQDVATADSSTIEYHDHQDYDQQQHLHEQFQQHEQFADHLESIIETTPSSSGAPGLSSTIILPTSLIPQSTILTPTFFSQSSSSNFIPQQSTFLSQSPQALGSAATQAHEAVYPKKQCPAIKNTSRKARGQVAMTSVGVGDSDTDTSTSTGGKRGGRATGGAPYVTKRQRAPVQDDQEDYDLLQALTTNSKLTVSKRYKKHSERQQDGKAASGGKKRAGASSSGTNLAYAKVDKEDPRSRLHFVKYMKKEGKTIKIWECGICGREFIHQYTLMRHLPTHTDERKFRCEECGKAFRQMSTLSQHRATHSKSRPYVCDVCKKTFNRVSTLISHKKIHQGVKQHICNVCGKAFHQKGNLKNHMFIHTNERPYKCYQCGRGFNQASNLHSHKIRAHSDNSAILSSEDLSGSYMPVYQQQQRVFCSFCPLSFNLKASLKKHEAAVHSVGPNRAFSSSSTATTAAEATAAAGATGLVASKFSSKLAGSSSTVRNVTQKSASSSSTGGSQPVKWKAGGVASATAGDIVANPGAVLRARAGSSESNRAPKRRKIGSIKVLQAGTGQETFHEMLKDNDSIGQLHLQQVPDGDLHQAFLPLADLRQSGQPFLEIPAITTPTLKKVLAAGETPFAMLKSSYVSGVVVKVVVLSPQRHALVPSTAQELRQASKITVTNRGANNKALQIKIPVVATVFQKVLANGETTVEILPPDEDYSTQRLSGGNSSSSSSSNQPNDKLDVRNSPRKYGGPEVSGVHLSTAAASEPEPSVAGLGPVLSFQINNSALSNMNNLNFTASSSSSFNSGSINAQNTINQMDAFLRGQASSCTTLATISTNNSSHAPANSCGSSGNNARQMTFSSSNPNTIIRNVSINSSSDLNHNTSTTSSLLSNVRASINTIVPSSRVAGSSSGLHSALTSSLSSSSVSPLMTIASMTAAESSAASSVVGGLVPTYLSVVDGEGAGSGGDLPSEVLPSQMGGQHELPLESDIIAETVSDSVLDGEVDAVSHHHRNMEMLSSAEAAGELSLGSYGHDFDGRHDGGHSHLMAGELEEEGDQDHLKVAEAELSGLRYLCATGAPGEFEMVAPDDPRLTHIVNEYGQLQEVTLQSSENVGTMGDDGSGSTTTVAMDGLTVEEPTDVTIGDTVGIVNSDGSLTVTSSAALSSTDGMTLPATANLTSRNASAGSVGGTITIGTADETGTITIGTTGGEGGGDTTGSITLTETGGLTIESGTNSVTVGEGGTVAVENIAALIGALQRAGVPVQLHQEAGVPVQLHEAQDVVTVQELGHPDEGHVHSGQVDAQSETDPLHGLGTEETHQILIATEEDLIGEQEFSSVHEDALH